MDNTATSISPGASMFYESTLNNALKTLLWLLIGAVGLSYAHISVAQDSPAVALMSENGGEGSSWEAAALETDRRDEHYVALIQLAQAPGALRSQKRQGTISGTVTDSLSGEPIPGVNVVIVGTQQGSATDANGEYTISGVEPGTYTLQASFVGYTTKTHENVEVVEGETTEVDFQLVESAVALEEVVAVGYGEQRREELTGSVSQVSGADIEDISAGNPTEALQGLSSGLNISRTGAPGDEISVRIRGLSTLNNNDPLFVVDGVETDNLLGINASDIESIDVLKDASASAIYGSRGSGGVILITTKSGRPGEMRVSFNSSVGIKNPHRRLDLLNTSQYIDYATDLRQSADRPPPGRFNEEGFPEEWPETDWQDAVLQRGAFTNNNFAVSGGTEDAQYRVSLGYTNEEGAIIESGFERYSLRVNSNFDTGRFQFSERFSVSHRSSDQLPGGGFSQPLGLAQRMPPYIPVYDPDNLGGYDGVDQVDNADDDNPVRELEHGFDHINTTQLTGQLTGEMQIVESLSLRTVFGVDMNWILDASYVPPFREGDFQQQDFTSISEDHARIFQPVSTTTLNIDQLGYQNHEVSGVFGFEIQNTVVDNLGGTGRNELTTQSSIAMVPSVAVSAGAGKDVLISTFGRINYNYAGRYVVQGALRRDGYSRFGPEDKWGLFPSVSAAWNVSEEAFMSDVSFLSNLRLRGSWGLTGNKDALNRYEFQSSINTGGFYNFGEEQAVAAEIPSLANPNLAWETTRSINAGIDLGFFNNALTFSGEYYENRTEDILLSVPLPASFGFGGGTRANTGVVKSTGFEFTAGYDSRASGDFYWSVDANFSTASNEVESLGLGSTVFGIQWEGGSGANRIAEGEPIWHWYGWEVDRLFQPEDFNEEGNLREGIPTQRQSTAPGDIKFKDLNGDGVITPEDRTVLGDPRPDYTYGLRASANWRSFDASLALQGVGGNQIASSYQFFTRGMTRVFNAEAVVVDRWTPDNTDTEVPRAVDGDPNNNARMSDRFIHDGDYLRLQRLTIGYRPDFISQLSQVRSVRIYVQGQDLLTLTGYPGYDPEVGANTGGAGEVNFGFDRGRRVTPQRFTIGVQLDF